MALVKVGIFVALILHYSSSVLSLTCLSCRGIYQPRHCHTVVDCLPTERCSVERYVDSHGQGYYNVGCKSQERCELDAANSIGRCDTCCETALCNAKGCGEPGYPANSGPICYKCDQSPKERSCYTVTACEQGEVCVVEEAEEFGDVMVSTGCLHQRECGSITQGTYIPSLVGRRDVIHSRRSTHSFCKQCCNGTLCNKQCSTQGPALTTIAPTTTQTTSTASTTSTTMTTTTSTTTTMATTQKPYPKDCLDIQLQDKTAQTGAYTINHRVLGTITVWCDMDTEGGGWTVLERRFNGSVDFYRNFTEYQNGFGNVQGGEFWLGLDNLYELTKGTHNMLRIEVMEYNRDFLYKQYSNFSIGPPRTYTLHVSGSSGNGTNEMERVFDGKAFTTMDEDQDTYYRNCAEMFRSAFWFRSCIGQANINGPYRPGVSDRYLYMTFSSDIGSRAITIMFKRY